MEKCSQPQGEKRKETSLLGPNRTTFTPNCPLRLSMGWMPVAYCREIKWALRSQKKRPRETIWEVTERKTLAELARLRASVWTYLNSASSSRLKPWMDCQDRKTPWLSFLLLPLAWRLEQWLEFKNWECLKAFLVSIFRVQVWRWYRYRYTHTHNTYINKCI